MNKDSLITSCRMALLISCREAARVAAPEREPIIKKAIRLSLRVLFALSILALVVGVSSPVEARAETAPSFFYGSAAIPRGQSSTRIGSRFISPFSNVFLTVDTTSWPGTLMAVPAIKVVNRANGFFTVATLDNTNAPDSGVPFNYVVFNDCCVTSGTVSYFAGFEQITAGQGGRLISNSLVSPSSVIILTVGFSAAALPEIIVSSKGTGAFAVRTLDGKLASTNIPFRYLVVNDSSRFFAGTGTISTNFNNHIVSTNASNKPAGIFVTVDITPNPAVGSLRGIRVHTHGAGFFQVTTRDLSLAPSPIPFTWVVFEPPPRWEEYGPTGISGNVWTIAVDPRFPSIVYTGSGWAGV